VKKVGDGKGDIQRTVDGHTQNDFMADLFANKYEDLYTSDIQVYGMIRVKWTFWGRMMKI